MILSNSSQDFVCFFCRSQRLNDSRGKQISFSPGPNNELVFTANKYCLTIVEIQKYKRNRVVRKA